MLSINEDEMYPTIPEEKKRGMLVLDRGESEIIRIGDDIEIKILKLFEFKVRLGFYAPKDVLIYRDEIYKKIKSKNYNSDNFNEGF